MRVTSPSVQPLADRLRAVTAKRRGVALCLWGEAGVGKTHAARQLLGALACSTVTVHAALPIADVVRSLPQPDRLPLWVGRGLEQLARGRVSEAPQMASILAACLSASAPVVLHVEDVHEASGPRRELLMALAQRAGRTRGIGLLATSRIALPEPFEGVRCEPLSAEGTRALLEGSVGAALPAEASSYIHRRAHGNPLFTIEYLRYLARQGSLWSDGQRWHWRPPQHAVLPVTVEALIEQLVRYAGGEQALEAALSARAILPVATPDALWAEVAGLTPAALQRARVDLGRRGILHETEFAHPLFREVTLSGLDRTRRRDLSRRALRALDASPQEAAAFIVEAELSPEEAAGLLERAALAAQVAGSEVRAARFTARAVDYHDGAERARLALQSARSLRHVDVAEASRLAEIAAQSLDHRTEAVQLQAELLAVQGALPKAEALLGTLPGAHHDSAWFGRLLVVRGVAHHYSGILELLEAHPETLTAAGTTIAHWAARALTHHGRPDEAREIVRRTAAQRDLSPEARVDLLRASSLIAYTRSDFGDMERLERELYELGRDLGNLRLMDQALFNRALALEHLGRFRERVASLEEAMQICRELGDTSAYIIAQVSYGAALLEFGEYERAEALLLEAHDYLDTLGFHVYLFDCETTLSRLYCDWRPAHGKILAVKHAQAALRCADLLRDPATLVEGLCVLTQAELFAGRLDEAARHHEEARARARELDLPLVRFSVQATGASLLDALGRAAEAEAAYREAVTEAKTLGLPLAEQRLGLELDRLLGDPLKAQLRFEWFAARELGNGVNLVLRSFPQVEADPERAVTTGGLRLEVLGPMQLSSGGETRAVRGQKRKHLLALLLEGRLDEQSEWSVAGLCHALYPDDDETEAQRRLKQLVFQVRATLGHTLILTTPGGYALGPVDSDAELFLAGGATTLWRGGYLDDVDTVETGLHDALYRALKARLAEPSTLHPGEAARVGRLLLDAQPYDLEALTWTLRAMQRSGHDLGLERRYSQSRDGLLEVGVTLPDDVGTFLAER